MAATKTTHLTMSSLLESALATLSISPVTLGVAVLALVIFALLPVYRSISHYFLEKRRYSPSRFPVASLPGLDPAVSFTTKGPETLVHAVKKYEGRPFQVQTRVGPRIMLPHRYANEIKFKPELSFSDAEAGEFALDAPELHSLKELFREGSLAPRVCVKLTQSLGLISLPVAAETTFAIRKHWPATSTWQKIPIERTIEDTVSCISSRAFIGKPLCRDPRWIKILHDHVGDVFMTANKLKNSHGLVQWFRRWRDPGCQRLQKQYKDAEEMFKPEIQVRRARLAKAREAGEKSLREVDTLLWMLEVGKDHETGVKDLVAAQLAMSIAAVHTTTATLTFMMMDLCLHPEYIAPLREEVVRVLREEGGGDPKKAWQKKTVSKLKFMDACFKESQRVHPVSYTVMRRSCRRDYTLSDGTLLPQGSIFHVVPPYLDPEVYSNPAKFDPNRFMPKEDAGEDEVGWQIPTTRPEHLAFGHGKHACPGRFFAADEVKILLSHLLLKYDFELVDAKERKDPTCLSFRADITELKRGYEIKVRRRQEEVDVDIEDEDEL